MAINVSVCHIGLCYSKIENKIENMRVKLMFVGLIIASIALVMSCSKDETNSEPEFKLSPSQFDVSVKGISYNFAEIEWTASLISDKSKIIYDVYLNDELKGKAIEDLKYRFEKLEALTTYNLEVIAKSTYETQVITSYSLTTIDTPIPAAVSLKEDDLSTDQITVSWMKSDPTQNLTYAIYLDDVLKAEKLDVNTYTFTELLGNKLYRIKLIAKNEFDKTVESILELTTSDYADPSDFTLSVESVSRDGAKIIWSGSESEELTYRILIDGVEKAKVLKVLDYEFKDLSFNVTYTATVEAINEHGKVKSKDIKFTTLDADSPADFKILVENISHESALVRWETTGDKNVNLIYGLTLNGSFKGEYPKDNQLLLDRLEAEKLYQLKIEAKNAYSKTLEKTIEFTTLAAPSLSDFTISAQEIKASSALLSWTECVATDGTKVTYNVYHPNGNKIKGRLEETKYQLTNLTPGKSVTYRVEAISNDPNIRSVSKTVTFEATNHEIPGDFELSLGEITKSQGEVKWTNSELPSGGAITYEAYLDGQMFTSEASGNAYIYKNLKAGTKYTAKIVAKSQNNTTNEQTINFTTEAEAFPELVIDVAEIGVRSFELNWKLTESPSYDSYELILNGKSIKSGFFKTYTFNELQSNTTYRVKVLGKRGGKTYQRELDVKTLAYPEALDFNMDITPDSFNHIEFDLNDFHAKNSDRFDDFSHMTFEAHINGVKEDWGRGVRLKTLTRLKEQTHYDFQLIIKHADGSIALEKNVEFTTPENQAPVWNKDLKIKATGFSFLELENNFASDPESESLTYKYYVNGVEVPLNKGFITKDTRDAYGQIEKRVNTNQAPVLLTHLISNKDYSFYIKAIDPLGKESISTTVNFKTAPDAKKTFELRAAIDPSVEHVGPYWMKMGEKVSIKEILIYWIIDGKPLGNRGKYVDPSKLIENGDQHSLDLDYSPFLSVKPDADISFTISIEWIDEEAFIGKSESNTIVVTP